MSYTTREIRELLLQYYDVEELVDVLEITAEELLEAFDYKLTKFKPSDILDVEEEDEQI